MTPPVTSILYLTPKAIANLCVKAVRHGDSWSMRCPAHEDKQASMKVSKGRKATIMYCHAGCSTQEILDELGVGMEQLYYDYDPNSTSNPNSATTLKLQQMLRDSKPPTMRELAPAHTLEDVLWPVIEADPYTWALVRVRWADYMSMPFVDAMQKPNVVVEAIAADLLAVAIDNGYDYSVSEQHRMRDRLEEQWEQTQPVTGS